MKKHRKSFILRLAICAFAVYITASLVYQAYRIRQNSAQLDLLNKQISEQQKENEEIKRVLAENDEQFMESVARDELGYAKPGERIFVDASGN
jgi:cell division protein FtsB